MAYFDAATAAPLHPVARQACWPRSTTAGPTPASCTAGPAGPPAARRRPGRRRGGAGGTPRRGDRSPPAAPAPCTRRCWAGWPAGRAPDRSWCTRRSSTRRCCTWPSTTSPPAARRCPYRWTGSAGSTWTPGGPRSTSPGWRWPRLISASHEVGTVQPVAEAAAGLRRRRGCRCWWTPPSRSGRVPVPAGWSMLTGQRAQVGRPARGGRAGGAQGTGALVARRRPHRSRTWPACRRWWRPRRRCAPPPPRPPAEAARLSAAGGPDPRHGGGDGARTSRWSATRSTGCRTW